MTFFFYSFFQTVTSLVVGSPFLIHTSHNFPFVSSVLLNPATRYSVLHEHTSESQKAMDSAVFLNALQVQGSCPALCGRFIHFKAHPIDGNCYDERSFHCPYKPIHVQHHLVSSQTYPFSFSDKYRSAHTIKWSKTSIPTILPASTNRFVTSMSSLDGSQ